jgi:predicted TIM-barrel fold metal-dependent hydrolase
MTSRPLRLDMHVHFVGPGLGGSGCWYPRQGRYRWLAPLIAWNLGFTLRCILRADFEQRYARRLLRWVRASSLDGIVVLAMDRARHDDGAPIHEADSFYVPNSVVLALAARHREFLPGISIHPARPDAFEELERGLAGGAALLKLIPSCQNIDLATPRYTRFWKRVAEARLPVLVHTGSEAALQEFRPAWGHPRFLEPLLRLGVTVIAAHCGGEFQSDFVAMLARYPNLYGDTSAFSMPFSQRKIPPLLAPGVAERLLNGSDTPVPISPYWAALKREIPFRRARELALLRNPFERDVQLKRALGFPDSLFTRPSEVLRPESLRALEKAVAFPRANPSRTRTPEVAASWAIAGK